MHILYLSQYFPPEIGATQTRAIEMASGLVRAGHSVTMIAEIPNHPAGIIPPEYKGKVYERTTLEGIEVIRVWVKASPHKDFRARLMFYISYMFSAIVAGLFLAQGKYDAIYASSPPLFVGGAGLVLSYLRRTPLFFEVRDLWPESAVVLGQINNQRYLAWATWLEESCYRKAKKIIVTSREIFERLVERDVQKSKLTIIRNGANIAIFKPDRDIRQKTRKRYGLDDRFVILYAGLHGLAYDLGELLKVADVLQEQSRIHFLLVGDGPTKNTIKLECLELRLRNVTFVDAQPARKAAEIFNAADVSIVPLRQPQIPGMFPVKIFDSLACQVPVILSGDGEPREMLEDCRGGVIADPPDAGGMSWAIMRLYDNPQLREELGEHGRKVVLQKYSRKAQAKKLASLLELEANSINNN